MCGSVAVTFGACFSGTGAEADSLLSGDSRARMDPLSLVAAALFCSAALLAPPEALLQKQRDFQQELQTTSAGLDLSASYCCALS